MRILLVEDHSRLGEYVRIGLVKAEFEVDWVTNGSDALTAAESQQYEAIILDLGLPDIDGIMVLRRLRARNCNLPIIILTSRIEVQERVRGLDAGADDYLTKPFALEELVARMRALLRRPTEVSDGVLQIGNVAVDTSSREVRVNGEIKKMTRREAELLEQLMHRGSRVIAKSLLESSLAGLHEELSSNSLEVLIHRLRKKLRLAGANVQIHTIHGVGYIMSKEIE